MSEGELQKVYQAVRCSVEQTVAKLGIEAVRALSWFPANRKDTNP